MDAHQYRFAARIMRYVALGDIDALQAVCDSSDTVEVWDISAMLDTKGVELELAGTPGLATAGGTIQGSPYASVVAFPGVPPLNDATRGGASTVCMFGTAWCPDPDGRVCADCAEFSTGGEAA